MEVFRYTLAPRFNKKCTILTRITAAMVISSSKPTLVIVPGGWHPPSAYRRFATHLEDAGYPTLTAPYPSCNSTTPKTATCGEDARSLRQQLLPLIDSEGKDVVLLSHSYGGIPAAGAAYGLSKNARSKASKKGGILGLVYMSAFAVPEGASLVEFLGGKHAPYLVPDKASWSSPRHSSNRILIPSPSPRKAYA